MKFACLAKKSGHAAWCDLHRRIFDNCNSDAKRNNNTDFLRVVAKKSSEEMDELLDVYLLQVGMPTVAGQAAGNFDWAAYQQVVASESNVTDSSTFAKMDHVAFIKFETLDRMKTRQKAEANWLQAIGDKMKYPGRDNNGPGECPDTLLCSIPECCGGRLRIHFPKEDIISVNNIVSERHESQMGYKANKKPTANQLESHANMISRGHEAFSASQYTSLAGKAVAMVGNPMSALPGAPEDDDDEQAPDKDATPKKRRVDGLSEQGQGSPDGVGQKKQIPLLDAIESGHATAERDVRRTRSSLLAGITEGLDALRTIPDEPHLHRLRLSLQVRLEAVQFWVCDEVFVASWQEKKTTSDWQETYKVRAVVKQTSIINGWEDCGLDNPWKDGGLGFAGWGYRTPTIPLP